MKSELESSLNRFTKNPTDTEDIFQKLIQRLLTVRDRDVGAPLHYIRRSMRNAGIEWIRQQREPNQVVSIQSDDALNLIDPRPGPYETAAAQQELQRILDALPPKCREVFRLVQIEGCSYAEAAALLRISTGTVKSH